MAAEDQTNELNELAIADLLADYDIDESAHFKLSQIEHAELSFKALAQATFLHKKTVGFT